jgi:uncharacterized protein involved in exopolysaccharide biosynthesis
MSAEHPQVKAARESQKQIACDVHEELGNAVRAVEVDLRVNTDRTSLLEEQLAATTARLEKLAALRAPYANQAAETRKRMDLMERAQERLADARTGQATAKTASLIARIDSPETGARPVGPGRAMLLAIGLAGGLVVGLGVLVLSIEPVGHVSNVPSTQRHAEDAPVAQGQVENMPHRNASLPPGSGAGSLAEALRRLSTLQTSYH